MNKVAKNHLWLGILAMSLVFGMTLAGCGDESTDSGVIGSTGEGGGKIIYYSEEGFFMTDTGETCHYLEAAPADMPTELAWATWDYRSIPIQSAGVDRIGGGRGNTDQILLIDENAPAAKACKQYSSGGKTDWFLPSKDELYELWKNRKFLDGIQNLENYWSSTQKDNEEAWKINFSTGYYQDSAGKMYTFYVRAIRAY